jgi:translocation and assembly module TamB
VRMGGTRTKHEASLRARDKEFDVRVQVRGGWQGDAGWTGELVSLVNEGNYPLRLLAAVPLEVSAKRIALGRLEAVLGEGRLLVREARWSEGQLSSRGEFSDLPASWLLVPAGLGQRVESTLRLDGQWSLASAPRLNGEVRLRRAGGDLTLLAEPALELGLRRATLDARFVDGQLGAHLQAESALGALSLQGELSPVPGAQGLGFAPHSPVSFKARFDFSELRALAAPYVTQGYVDGRLAAELQGSGTLERPVLTGTLSGERLRLDVPPHGLYLRDGRLRAQLEGDTLRVTGFSIRGGDGTLVATGKVPLGRNGERSLEWRASELRLLNRPDMRLVLSGNGLVRFDGEHVRLTGEARADRAYVELRQDRLPQLGDDVVVIGGPRETAPEKTRSPLELDMEFDLGKDFALRGRGFTGRLEGRLRIVGPRDDALLAYGKVSAVEATYLAYGRKLEVDPGVLIFDGPLDNPSLQITAWRRNQAVEAGVQLTGTGQAPIARLVSKPSVPEGERLSWLVLGRAPTDVSGADLGLLQTAAGALLARGDSVPLTDRIARAAGLDEFGLRGGGELSEQVVALGKRLSDRLYVSYEQGLGDTAMNLIKLDFALTERLSLRAETGTTSGMGLFYRFSWD